MVLFSCHCVQNYMCTSANAHAHVSACQPGLQTIDVVAVIWLAVPLDRFSHFASTQVTNPCSSWFGLAGANPRLGFSGCHARKEEKRQC